MNGPALAVPDKVAGQAAEGQKAPAEVDGAPTANSTRATIMMALPMS